MMYKEIEVSKLREHPENKKYFTDIKDTSESFWEEFKESVERFGIIEPLIVNEVTMQVTSGNQRLKACRELGRESVPCVLVGNGDKEEEIRRMVASNVYRRDLDPLKLFEYIGWLRRGYDGKPGPALDIAPEAAIPTQENIKKQLNKGSEFVRAADRFNVLSEEDQEAVRQWYKKEQEKGEKPTDKKLIAKVRELEQKALFQDQQLGSLNEEIRKRQNKIEELKEAGKDSADEIKKLRQEKQALNRALREEKEKDAAQRLVEVLGEAFLHITKQATSLATDIASFSRRMAKIPGSTDLSGIDVAISKSKLNTLKNELDKFFGQFGIKAIE